MTTLRDLQMGPSGPLAVVQAEYLRALLFPATLDLVIELRENGQLFDRPLLSNDQRLHLSGRRRSAVLAAALTAIIWRAGGASHSKLVLYVTRYFTSARRCVHMSIFFVDFKFCFQTNEQHSLHQWSAMSF